MNGMPIDLAQIPSKSYVPISKRHLTAVNNTLALPAHKLPAHPLVMATEKPNNPKDAADTVGLYFEFAWEFLWALNEASIGQVAGNLTLCTGNATTLYNRTQEIGGMYESILLAEGGQATYEVLKSVDPIVYSCYFSGFEYWVAIQIYFATTSDFNKLLYNFTHNLGNIYDLTEEAIFRFYDFEYEGETHKFW
jgi:hypothetical protein